MNNQIDLRVGEFYIWEEAAEEGNYEVYHTDTDDKRYHRGNDSDEWVEKANNFLKNSSEPVYSVGCKDIDI